MRKKKRKGGIILEPMAEWEKQLLCQHEDYVWINSICKGCGVDIRSIRRANK